MPVPRNPRAQDTEASATLKLGDFQDTATLSLSEARMIIDRVVETRTQQAQASGQRFQETETLAKTRDYLEAYAKFKQSDNVLAAERLILNYGANLAFFERSQIEEAKVLIPSLQNKISDQDLQSLLDELKLLRENEEM
ncbi:MAG: hypothetical protein Q9227_004176 [Pyrenula ochraceoflavens]